jgi:hypothetical protein
LRAFCRVLVVEISTSSPSRLAQTTDACGVPSGLTVESVT